MSSKHTAKKRLLTGDTPTGKLHLGHWVGSVENRVKLQEQYECFFILANIHAFTTRSERPAEIRQSTLDIAIDYLAAGIDPKKSVIFIESDVPAIYTLASIFSMLIPFPRLMRNPTLKDEIRDKQLGDNYSFGFLLYSVLQVADILAFLPEIVPVGEDQLPHLEMTREVARKFNQLYCGVDSHTLDADYITAGGLLPVITPLVGRVDRLIGLGPPNSEGRLLKMSKSLNNAILLSDDPDTVVQKVMSMYTDPKRLKASDPGTVENNPLWILHDIFNPDKAWVEQTKEQYRTGQIGDVACKKKLIEVLNALLEPFRRRRLEYQNDLDHVIHILQAGAEQANTVAEQTLQKVKSAIRQDY
ncbi:MAG: tryptophan--tRNA ligase [Proteobacteria bacterium]|nr:tryptophan--tRNA ligase [Pseudomonadota bacterium]